jgi:Tfp pilus assembly protein FimT
MTRVRRAFTLAEVVLIVLFMAVFAVIAVPRFNYSAVRRNEADCLAKKIVTDLRRTQTLAISNAAVNSSGFAMNMTGGSPYSGYEIEDLSDSSEVDSHTIDPDEVSCTGGSNFQFGPDGALKAGSDSSLTVSAEGKTYTISITAATGMVSCTGS